MARDKFHYEVRTALEGEGWIRTTSTNHYIMVNVKRCQKAILGILEDYATVRYANINAENKLIADTVNHRYQVVTIGWDKNKFVHDCPMHIDIIDGKVWIQRNMTEIDIAAILTEQGIAKSDIVLGFLTPKMREYGDYAVA